MPECPECGAPLGIGYIGRNAKDVYYDCDSCGWNEIDDAPSHKELNLAKIQTAHLRQGQLVPMAGPCYNLLQSTPESSQAHCS
jgi:hypothetical protein